MDRLKKLIFDSLVGVEGYDMGCDPFGVCDKLAVFLDECIFAGGFSCGVSKFVYGCGFNIHKYHSHGENVVLTCTFVGNRGIFTFCGFDDRPITPTGFMIPRLGASCIEFDLCDPDDFDPVEVLWFILFVVDCCGVD